MDSNLLSARQAAARLGVKVETLYAYVSRGELTNHRPAGTRASLFDEAEVDQLRERGRSAAGGGATAVLETQLTAIRDG